MRLVLAEKPSVARDLARVLGATRRGDGFLDGDGLRITWCVGHLVELEDPERYDPRWKRWRAEDLPMLPESFALRPRKEGKDQWAVVRGLLRDQAVREVVNACDAGREGELIFRFCYELAGCRASILRLWVNSLTPEAIRHAWSHLQPGAAFDRLAAAARSRAEADWLVGLNATRALTCRSRAVGGGVVLSVGRVQTPTLALIVARDAAIDSFVPEAFWRVEAELSATAGRWVATWVRAVDAPDEKPEDERDAPPAERIADEPTARAIAAAAAGRQATLRDSDRRSRREPPPLLYDLTSLQRRANVRYGYTAEQTLGLAQGLYEAHKLITYPRTDARYLTPDQVPLLPDVVRGVGEVPVYAPFAAEILSRPIHPGRRVVDATEVGDHHAILPTGRVPDPGRLSVDEKRIFDLVARRLLAALSPDAVIESAVLVAAVATDAPLPDDVSLPLLFRAHGRVVREPGWRRVDPPGKSRDVELPAIRAGDRAQVEATRVIEGRTRPPPRFTDATLLRGMETAGRDLEEDELAKAMKRSGLGTPATRASILETLIRRAFVVREERALRATDRGRAVVASVSVPELKSAELTGRWEARLHDVAEGSLDRASFMRDVRAFTGEVVRLILAGEVPVDSAVADVSGEAVGACPRCGRSVRANTRAWVCEGGAACGFVVFRTMSHRVISDRMARELLAHGRTRVVKGFKSKAGRPFEAGLVVAPDGRVGFVFDQAGTTTTPPPRAAPPDPPQAPASPEGRPCPSCGIGRVVRGRASWGCDRWRDGCGYRLAFGADA